MTRIGINQLSWRPWDCRGKDIKTNESSIAEAIGLRCLLNPSPMSVCRHKAPAKNAQAIAPSWPTASDTSAKNSMLIKVNPIVVRIDEIRPSAFVKKREEMK